MVLNETLPTVESIKKSGKARFLGITGYPVSTLNEILEKSSTKINSVLSYCRLTMIDDTLKSFIPRFKVRKLFFIESIVSGLYQHSLSETINDFVFPV